MITCDVTRNETSQYDNLVPSLVFMYIGNKPYQHLRFQTGSTRKIRPVALKHAVECKSHGQSHKDDQGSDQRLSGHHLPSASAVSL